jgi:hypothetical protein
LLSPLFRMVGHQGRFMLLTYVFADQRTQSVRSHQSDLVAGNTHEHCGPLMKPFDPEIGRFTNLARPASHSAISPAVTCAPGLASPPTHCDPRRPDTRPPTAELRRGATPASKRTVVHGGSRLSWRVVALRDHASFSRAHTSATASI